MMKVAPLPAGPASTVIDAPRRRLGLAGRAGLFVSGLLIVTGALAAAAVLFGLEREGARHQTASAREVAGHVSGFAARRLALGQWREVDGLAARLSTRLGIEAVSVYDAHARTLVARGATRHAGAMAEVGAQVISNGRPARARSADGALVVGEPVRSEGRLTGAAVVAVERDGFRYDSLHALAPFLLFLACLILAAAPIVAFLARRALAPLDALTRFAERVAENGAAEPVRIKSGDEFETLANAFNHMIARLDASMRKIQEIAFVDPVTQLPNQDRFLRELEFYMNQARREGVQGAVIVVEFERLPQILQSFDAGAARELARDVSARFMAAARSAERLAGAPAGTAQAMFAARLGASSFALIVPRIASPAEAARVGQHLVSTLGAPFAWREHRIHLGAACGVAMAPDEGRDAHGVVRNARLALAAATQAPARLKIFTASLDRDALARVTFEREMRAALERGEFHAFFQPKTNFANGRIEAAEALARWVRADRVIVGPARFIPFAEESGLIGELSDAILRQACWKGAAWARAGAPIKIAVNVSALQFRDDHFGARVMRILERSGLAPGALELELTESVALEDPDRALRQIAPLREAGVRFAIDDFGCGHSNLAALSKLHFDVIKIDQQFVAALGRGDAHAGAIIEMILALARALGLEVVAEGVERREQADFMASRGCQWGQGFLFGAAMPAFEFAAVLEAKERRALRGREAA